MQTLKGAGFEAFIVGGAVRDLLILKKNNSPAPLTTDYDFATNATPEEIQKLFPESFYENEFGTVAITAEELAQQAGFEPTFVKVAAIAEQKVIDLTAASKIHASLSSPYQEKQAEKSSQKSPNFEITTYRSQELYSNFRKPDSLQWGTSIEEDLTRRDFSINALALTLTQEVSLDQPLLTLAPDEYTLIDLHHGLADLDAHLIRTVGDPATRFQEDALRMLRAIRLSVQLNFEIEEQTFAALLAHHELLDHISAERIRDEFLKMLKSEYPAEAIELLDETQLLEFILPELLAAKGVQQGGHHTTDVWTHSLDALRYCPSPDPIVRLATLLHDIAKPDTYAEQNGTITFYNHEIIGARVAKKIAQRLRLSKEEQDRIFTLVRYHMFHYQPENTDAAIRRFMRKVGLNNINDILDLREGDRLGSGARQTSWRLEEMKQRMIAQLHQPFDINDLAIDGHDLMREFNLQPGKVIGEVLHYLFEQVLENPELNTPEHLVELAHSYLETQDATSNSTTKGK